MSTHSAQPGRTCCPREPLRAAQRRKELLLCMLTASTRYSMHAASGRRGGGGRLYSHIWLYGHSMCEVGWKKLTSLVGLRGLPDLASAGPPMSPPWPCKARWQCRPPCLTPLILLMKPGGQSGPMFLLCPQRFAIWPARGPKPAQGVPFGTSTKLHLGLLSCSAASLLRYSQLRLDRW